MSMGVAVTCYGMPDGWKGQLLKSWLTVVAHSSPEVARPLSFKTSQFNESRQLICNFLLHFSAGRRVNERRGSRLRFVLSEALAAVMAVSYPSPGTAVAPGCRQFRGWIVCALSQSVTWVYAGRLVWHTLRDILASPWVHVSHFEKACRSWEKCLVWMQIEHYDDVSCCFRPLQEWGNVWLNVRGKGEEGLLLGKNLIYRINVSMRWGALIFFLKYLICCINDIKKKPTISLFNLKLAFQMHFQKM